MYRTNMLRTVPAVVLSALLFLPISSAVYAQAAAQANTDVIEEVLVTARKREESVLEIPESLSVISGEDINRQNVKALKDVGFKVPNLNLSMRLDGFPNVSIRGLGAFGNTQGVGFYLDDVQLFSDASSRFGDLARIEVLKGPQGVLYGGSNIGGAVKFVSARPDSEEAFGRVKVLGGEQGMIDVEGSVNAPLGGNGWAMRLFGFGSSHDGFIKNRNAVRHNGHRTSNKKNSGETEAYGGRVMIGGPLAERLSMLFTARWNEYDGPNNTWSRELKVEDWDYPTTINTGPENPRHERRTYAGMVELTWELDGFDIVSVSSFTDTHSNRYSDVDGTPEFLLDLFRPEKMNVLTQDLRFTSTTDSPLQWIAGVYYSLYDENMDSDLIIWDSRVTADGRLDGVLGCIAGDLCSGLWAGEIVPPEEEAEAFHLPFEYRRRDKSHLAAYGNVTYDFDEWEVALGIRIDQWKNKSLNYDAGIESSLKETEVLPRGSVTRWLNDDSMIYATIAFGYEPGGLNIGADFGLAAVRRGEGHQLRGRLEGPMDGRPGQCLRRRFLHRLQQAAGRVSHRHPPGAGGRDRQLRRLEAVRFRGRPLRTGERRVDALFRRRRDRCRMDGGDLGIRHQLRGRKAAERAGVQLERQRRLPQGHQRWHGLHSRRAGQQERRLRYRAGLSPPHQSQLHRHQRPGGRCRRQLGIHGECREPDGQVLLH